MQGIHVCQECLCPNAHVLTIEHILVYIIPEHVCIIVILFSLDLRPRNVFHYTRIKTEHLKFMDILQFLAPGYNLESFFKAFGVSEQKGFFPYDYFTHADQLDETTLPPYETFYSIIKNCNVLEEEYASFQKLLEHGKS